MSTIAVLPENMRRKITVVGECWEWWGAKNSSGYGSMTNGKGGSALAHRRAYEIAVGPIPEGLQIDHLCLNKICVRPEHLEAVTARENLRRQYVSKWGRLPDYGPLADPKPPVVYSPMDEAEAARFWEELKARMTFDRPSTPVGGE